MEFCKRLSIAKYSKLAMDASLPINTHVAVITAYADQIIYFN